MLELLYVLLATVTGIDRQVDPGLVIHAQRRAIEIQSNFNHTSVPLGWGEVIGTNTVDNPETSTRWIVQGWRESPPHWTILSDPDYSRIGCAVTYSGSSHFWVCLVAVPPVDVVETPPATMDPASTTPPMMSNTATSTGVTMARRPNYLAWIDLETTGSDESKSDAAILEIGWVLTKNEPGFPILSERFVVEGRPFAGPDPEGNQVFHWNGVRGDLDPVVIEMHEKNGLWVEAADAKLVAADFDVLFAKGLEVLDGGRHIGLAGSGVSHFDRRWIKKFLPRTDARLSHYSYDVGTLRRFFALAGADNKENPKGLSHRALDDARDHRLEAIQYVDMLRMFSNGW